MQGIDDDFAISFTHAIGGPQMPRYRHIVDDALILIYKVEGGEVRLTVR